MFAQRRELLVAQEDESRAVSQERRVIRPFGHLVMDDAFHGNAFSKEHPATCEVAQMGKAVDLAATIGELLVERGWTLGVAESCTGGLICHSITNVPGSSTFFVGGIVSYANSVKEEILGVPKNVLAAHGAVSQRVALSMAQEVRRALGTDVGIGVTGIAGPTGGSPEKPVGTVFIALSSPLGDEARHYTWDSDREGNKRLSAEEALSLLQDQLTC